MAIKMTLKGITNPLTELAALCGFGPKGETLAANGFTMSVEPKQIKILTISGNQAASLNVTSEAFNLMIQGKLADTSVTALSNKLEAIYDTALAEAGDPTLVSSADDIPAKASVKKATAKKPAKPVSMEAILDDTDAGAQASTGSGGIPAHLPIVKLADTTALLQRVKGSSEGSIYFTVARGAGIALAARVKVNGDAWSISVRMEGAKMADYSHGISNNKMSNNSSYASCHLNGEQGKYGALKAIGAFILGLNIPFTEVCATPAVIFNKGH